MWGLGFCQGLFFSGTHQHPTMHFVTQLNCIMCMDAVHNLPRNRKAACSSGERLSGIKLNTECTNEIFYTFKHSRIVSHDLKTHTIWYSNMREQNQLPSYSIILVQCQNMGLKKILVKVKCSQQIIMHTSLIISSEQWLSELRELNNCECWSTILWNMVWLGILSNLQLNCRWDWGVLEASKARNPPLSNTLYNVEYENTYEGDKRNSNICVGDCHLGICLIAEWLHQVSGVKSPCRKYT